MNRKLVVWSNNNIVGHLKDQDGIWQFIYAQEWLSNPDGFDLSPSIDRASKNIIDTSSERPVQWYFDNLLPEELVREVLTKEAKVELNDSFGLLAYFGSESAGSLIILYPEQKPIINDSYIELSDHNLSQRIRNLPYSSLIHKAPKKMSLAGAQHKLLVFIKDNQLYEPTVNAPSTWILKPAHQSRDYPSSVVNEYFSMRLASELGLKVPKVDIKFVPEPVYLVERFDRVKSEDGQYQRLHVIDTCQLLNKSASFKYHSANIESMIHAINNCLSPAQARQYFFEWLVFNLLIGNGDNHLKNLSFLVDKYGVFPAPFYDLLSTAVYETKAIAQENANWPHTELAFSIGKSRLFSDITHQVVIDAAIQIGLSESVALRLLNNLLNKMPLAVEKTINEAIEIIKLKAKSSPEPELSEQVLASDQRLLRSIQHIIIPDMIHRLRP